MTEVLVNIDVPDIDRGVRFYAEAFGFRLSRRLGPEVVELDGASSRIYLVQHAEGTRPFRSSPSPRIFRRHWTPVHLDFVVPDLEMAIDRATAAGATQEGAVSEFAWGRFAVLSDPFGNGFCVVQFKAGGYSVMESGEG